MRPLLDDLVLPLRFSKPTVWIPGHDYGHGCLELREFLAVGGWHRIVTGYEHAIREVGTELLQEARVSPTLQAKLSYGLRIPAPSRQFSRDALVEVLIDNEQACHVAERGSSGRFS